MQSCSHEEQQEHRAAPAQVDPHAKNVGKMEDEVPALFKRLRYPFAISKSALFAVGSPHTWPGLLAALAWLVELLCYEEKAVRRRCGPALSRTCPAMASAWCNQPLFPALHLMSLPSSKMQMGWASAWSEDTP